MILNRQQQQQLFNLFNAGNNNNSISPANYTFILEMNDIELARMVGNIMNNGIVRLRPDMALE